MKHSHQQPGRAGYAALVSVIPIDWEQSRTLVGRAADDLATLLKTVPDGSTPVPGLDWNISEVGAHLVTCAMGYTEYAGGASSALEDQTMAELNEERLREYKRRDPSELADQLIYHTQAFLAAIATDDSLMSLSDVSIDRATAAGVLLGELRIHELDIVRALRRKWTMTREEALIVTYAALPITRKFVDHGAASGFNATFEVRFRGGETVTMAFNDGELEVTRGRAARADCRMWVDPVATLLLGYGRVSHWRVGLRGKAVVWGRKPWLTLRFDRLLQRV